MMAEASVPSVRDEWHTLLVGIKSTVEGLLATQCTNVWNTYGGLARLCADTEKILNHKLKVTQSKYGSALDFWNFVSGLRWLNPVMWPSIKHFQRNTRGDLNTSEGQMWVRQSLLSLNLSSQLQILVDNKAHLHHNYEDEAFLCQGDYFQALVVCLQAVEQNKPALLAELNPSLLSSHYLGPRRRSKPPRLTHVRSASLPVNQVTESVMIRGTRTPDRLAPPMLSPKSQSILSTSHEYAKASSGSSPESAKDALLQVLTKSGSPVDLDEDYTFYKGDCSKHLDPLLNLEIYNSNFPFTASRRASHSGVYQPSVERKNNQRNNVMEGSQTVHQSNNSNNSSDSVVRTSKSAELLNKILSEEDVIIEVGEEQKESTYEKSNTISHDHILSNRISYNMEHQDVVGSAVSRDSGISLIPASESSTERTEVQPKTGKKYTHVRSMSDFMLPTRPTEPKPQPLSMSPDSASLSANYGRLQGMSDGRRRDSYFPRPTKGQSLIDFLLSQDFKTCAEMDKENAHFSISEALIAAIEQMKWNQVIRPQQDVSDHEEGDSDEEIQELKQRIRIRRRECLKEKAKGFPTFSYAKTDTSTTTTATSMSYSEPSTDSFHTDSATSSSEDIHDEEISGADGSETSSNLTNLKESGLSLSMASLYSDADIQKAINQEKLELERKESLIDNHTSTLVSAESVAISLLKRFSEKHLPKASELEWLVSEQDAPQALLPLPDSYPVSPDEGENADLRKMTRLRGNLEWAPPRAQIIFNIHPPPKRKVVLAKQNYRCAGCGAKVEPGYMKRYHYCEYLGKFFCPRCHTNKTNYIPGRILRKWDFTKYYVSNFAADLLTKIHREPLFNIEDINSSLYRKVRVLDTLKECRTQLYHLKMFLETCRKGESLFEELNHLPAHWTTDIHAYAIEELVQVKLGHLLPKLKYLVNECIAHVSQCPLCQAKGFICELCNLDQDIIYPFELQRITQCPVCRACYHKVCYIPDKCPKCSRIEARQRRLQETQVLSDEDDEAEDNNGNKR